MTRFLASVLALAAMACGASNSDRPSPAPVTQPSGAAVTPTVHSQGTFMVKYEGVHVPASRPNEDGPYVTAAVDLDEGTRLRKTTEATDLHLWVHARNLRVSLSTPRGVRAVEAGVTPAGFETCFGLLWNGEAQLRVSNQAAPTQYVCLQTVEGRPSVFRVLSVVEQPANPPAAGFISIVVTLEHTTWEGNRRVAGASRRSKAS